MRSMIALAALAFAASPGFAATELVVNGGFEQKAVGTPSSFQVGANYIYGPDAVTGWTVSGNNPFNVLFDGNTATTVEPDTQYSTSETQVLAAANYGGVSPNGGNFFALDGDTQFNGPLSQTINGLAVGGKYRLKFFWAATQFQNRTGETTENLLVTFGDQSFQTPTVTNPTHGFQGWFTESTLFTATSTSQVLSFLSQGTPNGLPPVALLDGVSLQSAVPEPTTWAMLIIGFGLVGAVSRRRALAAA